MVEAIAGDPCRIKGHIAYKDRITPTKGNIFFQKQFIAVVSDIYCISLTPRRELEAAMYDLPSDLNSRRLDDIV